MKDAEETLHHIEMDCDSDFSKSTAITSIAADIKNGVDFHDVDFKPVIGDYSDSQVKLKDSHNLNS